MIREKTYDKQANGNIWMRHLAFQYRTMREKYPDERLMIVFDIDGTILDMRHMMMTILKNYDRRNSTSFFGSLGINDISMHENDIGSLLEHMQIMNKDRQDIITWYERNYWSEEFMAESQRPFSGVVDVIRWFQIQPNTFVGLNTGRQESLRHYTLAALNSLGEEYRVRFKDDLLYMNKGNAMSDGKVDGIRYFESRGFRVFAMVDNEPVNLRAIDEQLPGRDILLLHADTIFTSSSEYIPEGAASGNYYDLTELIPDKTFPQHVQFVWHGVNNEHVLRQFLISNVHWAELHVRFDMGSDRIILRRRSFDDVPFNADEQIVLFEDILSVLKETDRGIKLDIKDYGLIRRVIPILKNFGFEDDRIWINGTMDKLHRRCLQYIREEFPGSIRQCPVDFMGLFMLTSPRGAHKSLEMFARWGISRFSISWKMRNSRKIIHCLQNWGYEVNIYNVPDLEAFLQAVLTMPRSITSYFNFPKWFMDGRQEENYPGRHHYRKIA